MKFRLAIVLLFAVFAARLFAQTVPGHELSDFVAANELFGRKLLSSAHASAPDKNVVVSPLPVSFAFAPLIEATSDNETLTQITSAFEWRNTAINRPSGRILSAAFKQPPPARPRPHSKVSEPMWQLMNQESPEELWLSSLFTYRGKHKLSEYFIDVGTKYFGLKFHSIPSNSAQSAPSFSNDSISAAIPKSSEPRDDDFWITSTTHLRTAWADSTFSLGKQTSGNFFPETGGPESVPMLASVLNMYDHENNQDFESVVFVGLTAYIQVVLPSEGVRLSDLEDKIIRNPSYLSAAQNRELGYIEIPKFNFEFKTDVRETLEKMGVRKVFKTPLALAELVSGPEGAYLNGVSQETRIEFDEAGIRADAETATTGVYGRIMGGQPKQFHMIVNRPFLFFIRDNVTNSLLFAGAVMDPAKH